MKKLLIIITIVFCTIQTTKGQNLFFIGGSSYPCSETIELQANSKKFFINDLNVLFGKDEKRALFIVSTETENVLIRDATIIYLDDGAVITLSDVRNYDYVDKIASIAYYLTDEDLNKIKNSNINTVRYTLTDENGNSGAFGGNFSASNKSGNYNFTALVSDFFN